MHAVTLHRAPWVVPVSSPVIRDGCVAAGSTQILETGSFADLRRTYPDAALQEHTNCVLTPALVNAHIHLELSHILIPKIKKNVAGFTDWIETLLSMREKMEGQGDNAVTAAREALQLQHQQGIAVIGDIGNTNIGARLQSEFPGTIIHFNECLGRTRKTRNGILTRARSAGSDTIFTAHAPYSTHQELIRELKERARLFDHPFSIHVAEPPSENELLCCGTGALSTFLKQRGFIDNSYQPPAGIDSKGSVQYLYDLGVLDKRTICVHCIHVSQEEVQLLADTQTKICLCPGSNRYLQVGIPPVEKYLEAGILPALGTDSLASNPELSLWREMKILQEEHPDIDPADIFAMGTLGGARTLGLDALFGALESGRSSRFLSIRLDEKIMNETMLYSFLVQQNDLQPTWVKEQ